MKTYEPKLACVASGLSFEEWRLRPVYRAHCFTASVAGQLLGLPATNFGRVTVYGDPDYDGLTTFRALAKYRSEAANALRTRVALHIRSTRQQRLLKAA